jgi:hypothetical protein
VGSGFSPVGFSDSPLSQCYIRVRGGSSSGSARDSRRHDGTEPPKEQAVGGRLAGCLTGSTKRGTRKCIDDVTAQGGSMWAWRSLRSRSAQWWVLALCSFLAVGAYIVFDVLDVDGSELQNRILHSAIAAGTSGAEIKRSVHEGIRWRVAWHGMKAPGAIMRLSLPFQTLARAVPEVLQPRRHWIYPRAHTGSLNSLSASSPADDLPRMPVHRI